MKPGGKTRIRNVLFWLGLSLPTAALLAMAWLVHQSNGQFNHSFGWIIQTYRVLGLYEQTQTDIVEAEANQRGYLLTGRREYLEPYHAAMQSLHADLVRLKQVTSGSPSQHASLVALEKMVKEDLIFDPEDAVSSNAMPSGATILSLTASGKQKIEAMQQLLLRAQQDLQADLSRRQQEAEADAFSSQKMSLILIAAVAMALVLVVTVMMRLEKLQEFVTVCAWTGQVQFQGQWLRMDEYLKRQFGIKVSHTVSEKAADKMMKEVQDLNQDNPQNPPPAS